uniref:Subtilisin-like protease n=1 Tax=Leersia perrieri TaxID=77586 RepID=A0A0D9VQV0_9ORYZ
MVSFKILCFLLCFILAPPLSTVDSADKPSKPTTSPSLTSHAQSKTHPGEEYRTYIILLWPPTDPEASAMGMDEAAHCAWYESFLPTKLTDAGEPRLLRSYRFVFNGFAATLTEAELKMVAKKRGFLRSFPDRVRHLCTTYTPEFIGLSKGKGVWSDTNYGKGVIIGVIDSGINDQHPSLDDHDIMPPPMKWKGSCQGNIRCNNKLIGAKTFVAGDDQASDQNGHGTHTATTAAGNFVEYTSLHGLAPGTAAGVAPGAHLAVYKACQDLSCNDQAILHAMDAAIGDGVDVISVSISKRLSNIPYDHDPVAIGAFTAMWHGVLVVASAGNRGPNASSIANDTPWILTVGAGSVDRSFPAQVWLQNGDTVPGESLADRTASTSDEWFPLHYSNDPAQRYCNYPEIEGQFTGKIVVCDASSGQKRQRAIIENLLGDNDAEGVVLIDLEEHGYTTILQDYGPNVIQVPNATAGNLRNYSMSEGTKGMMVFRNETVLQAIPAPVVAHFSSRGPSLRSPGLIKPDILAPGLNILAGTLRADFSEAPAFQFRSGTSMATPHVSGVAALIRSRHPDWSAAAIKSAIMTTTTLERNDGGGYILDHHLKEEASGYARGAGLVNAKMAMDPGLIYDISASDYVSYLCTVFGEAPQQAISRIPSWRCSDLPQTSEAMLNYPSITVPLQPTPFTVVRTLTNVGPPELYAVTVFMPEPVTVTVFPRWLFFNNTGDRAAITLTVSGHTSNGQPFIEGNLMLSSLTHSVRNRIIAVVGLGGTHHEHGA